MADGLALLCKTVRERQGGSAKHGLLKPGEFLLKQQCNIEDLENQETKNIWKWVFSLWRSFTSAGYRGLMEAMAVRPISALLSSTFQCPLGQGLCFLRLVVVTYHWSRLNLSAGEHKLKAGKTAKRRNSAANRRCQLTAVTKRALEESSSGGD